MARKVEMVNSNGPMGLGLRATSKMTKLKERENSFGLI